MPPVNTKFSGAFQRIDTSVPGLFRTNVPVSGLTLGGVAFDPGFFGGYGSVLTQIFSRNYPTYGIGLQLNLPLRNRIAEADLVLKKPGTGLGPARLADVVGRTLRRAVAADTLLAENDLD